MRVLLVSANTERTAIIPLPLGPAFVAAACRRAGHETVLLDLMSERDAIPALQKRIEEFRPGVIGISVRNIDDQNMASPKFLLPAVREVVAVCRRLCDAPIVLGGPGYSMFPESALRFLQADMGIRGEGEAVFPELLERLESKFCTVDNTFNIPPSYAKGYCREIIRRGLDVNLWCIVYPKWVERQLVELMARAGCHEVSLGLESGSDCVLTRFHKKFRAGEVRSTAGMFREAGIRRTGFLMLGGPGETRGTVEESLAFTDSLDLDALKITGGIR